MNDSLQSELQVRSRGSIWRRVPAAPLTVAFVCVGQKKCRDVEESERLVETLQAEVSALRERVREKKHNRAAIGTTFSNCCSSTWRDAGSVILMTSVFCEQTTVDLSRRRTTCGCTRPSQLCLPALLCSTRRR